MPGTTNFLQFNPTQANQETDAEYSLDSTRVGGAGVDAIWPSASANKTLYQATTMTAALGQMLANKGFSVSDASYAALVAQLANILTTADSTTGIQTLAWSPSITLNAASFNAFAVPLQGTTTLSLTGVVAGRVYVVFYTQNGVGSWGVTFGSGFSANAAQPDPAANLTSAQIFIADASLTLQPIGPLISSGGVNSTPIGNSKPSTGVFSSLICPTRTAGDSTTNAASTAFVTSAVAVSHGSNSYGYWERNSSGKLDQWGSATVNNSSFVTFPTPFSQLETIAVSVQVQFPGGHGGVAGPRLGETTTAGFYTDSMNFDTNGASWTIYWRAVGY